MIARLKNMLNLARNMGARYVSYRVKHEVLRRTGLLKGRFPKAPATRTYITLGQWKELPAKFFFQNRSELMLAKKPSDELAQRFQWIKEGKLLMFNSLLTDLGTNYDWITNPDAGYVYDITKHWTEIPDYSPQAGDIKYVWEKSRFSDLYDIIRYDHHFSQDNAELVFRDIISWIDKNPVNCGPNYRCSQEMSLRILNWTFALHFYRDSPALSEAVFSKMQYAIYWHLHHIYNNINFSRIAVRNNHAITETLMLYLAGIFYPTLPGVQKWKEYGKKWFEEEIAYQVYEDGTFLQFSMNYHRVVIQLLTWAITLSEKNGEVFSEVVYDRARKSVQFLRTCMVEENGWLPNYGANDGALFFRLSDTHYRDYRPQLQALSACLGMDIDITTAFEDELWYGSQVAMKQRWSPKPGIHSFDIGGYYIIREPETLTFIRCGSYKDRPSQADNLHLDVWYKGRNVLMDAGSYKYNTDSETIRYFSGTRSHNTVMLNDLDQMQKGGRFIWYNWTKRIDASIREEETLFRFKGSIHAFAHLSPGITHTRTITKRKGEPTWVVHDVVSGAPHGTQLTQLWHVAKEEVQNIELIPSKNSDGAVIVAEKAGWYSSLYGAKEENIEMAFSVAGSEITTTFSIKGA
ncbi:MAG: alginate lyase family protein [Taibaiella sp.]|nr:alginate lyase family protein [Taibaiella sp.]